MVQVLREEPDPRIATIPVAQLLLEKLSCHFVLLLDGMQLGRGAVDARGLKLVNTGTAGMLVTLDSEGQSPKVYKRQQW